MDQGFIRSKPFQTLRSSIFTVIMEGNRQCGPHHLSNQQVYWSVVWSALIFKFYLIKRFQIREFGEAQKHKISRKCYELTPCSLWQEESWLTTLCFSFGKWIELGCLPQGFCFSKQRWNKITYVRRLAQWLAHSNNSTTLWTSYH